MKDTRVLDSVQATCIDGTTVERLQRLGRMADPVHGHQERSLHRWLRDLFGHSLEPYDVTFKLQKIEKHDVEDVPIPTIPIWMLLRALHRAGDLQFQVSMLGQGGYGAAQSFWELARTQVWGQTHPALQGKHGVELGKIIPLQIHVDGLEIYKNTEFLVFSISSVISQAGNLFDSKFQIMKIPYSIMHTAQIRRGVMQMAAAYFSWNFRIIMDGSWPTTGFYGETLAPEPTGLSRIMDEYTAAFAFFKSDGKARVECHGFNFYYSKVFCCDCCLATQPFPSALKDPALRALLFTDFSRTAHWRDTEIDHDTYMAHSATISPWAALPGWRKELCVWDFMHVGPLGFLRDFTASLCLDFLLRGELAAEYGLDTSDNLLRKLWIAFRLWCKSRNLDVPKGCLSLKTIGRTQSNEYPELASSIKASVVKTFTVVLAQFSSDRAAGDDYTRLRASCAWGISEFIYVSDTCGLILTAIQVQRLAFGARTYLATYAALAQTAAEHGRYVFKVRPKGHAFEHLVDFAERSKLNPRHLAAWHEESYLGKIKTLRLKCAGKSMLRQSLMRYFLYLGLRWERRRQTFLWNMPT